MKNIADKFQNLYNIIQNNKRFVLTSHVHTDGDAIGCLIAMFGYIETLKKQVDIFIPGDVPPKYRFLGTDSNINKLKGQKLKDAIQDAEVIIILDVSALTRLEQLYPLIKNSKAKKVCIDHHPFDADWIDLEIIDTDRVATGEIIYEFFKTCNIQINKPMASALYTAILSDSGSFRFQRTDSFTFDMAADLVKLGVDPAEMYGRVYENGTQKQLKAWGDILANVKSKGNLSWLVVPREILNNHKISLEEIDGIIDVLRKIKQALIVIVFVEKEDKEILVGLRSKNGFDVGNLARRLGGGGHFHAAGFTGFEKLDLVVEETLQMIEKMSSK